MGKSDKKKNPWKIYKNYEIIENTNRETDNCPVVFFVTHLFLCNCQTDKNHWESSLKDGKNGEACYGCGRPSVMPYQQVIGTTPYQGPNRVYGVFRCHKCMRMWESAYSWASTSQKCEVCQIQIFPYDQDNLQFQGVKNRNKGHQMAFCDMCLKINGDCSKIKYNPYVNVPGLRTNRSRRRNRAFKKPDNNQFNQMVAPTPDIIGNHNASSAVLEAVNDDHQQVAGAKNKRKRRQRGGNSRNPNSSKASDQIGSDNALIKAVENLLIHGN